MSLKSIIQSLIVEALTEIRDDSDLDDVQKQIKSLPDSGIWFMTAFNSPHQAQYEVRLKPKELDNILLQKELEETEERPIIDIEFDNFNKIHMGGLPDYFLNLGLGKKIYEKICDKLGMISSTGDRSESAQRVWDSLKRSSRHYCVSFEGRDFLISRRYTEHSIQNVKEYLSRWNPDGQPLFSTLPPKYEALLSSR